jgi:hypothetical protein
MNIKYMYICMFMYVHNIYVHTTKGTERAFKKKRLVLLDTINFKSPIRR